MPNSKAPDQARAPANQLLFELLNEVNIIAQLSRTMLEARLDDDLTMHHFTALNHLVRLGDGKEPIAMARAFQVPKTSMSHTLAGLEKRGLVTLVPNPNDGRGKLVMLTEAGRAMRERAIASVDQDISDLLPQLDGQTLTVLLPELRQLRYVLDQQRFKTESSTNPSM